MSIEPTSLTGYEAEYQRLVELGPMHIDEAYTLPDGAILVVLKEPYRPTTERYTSTLPYLPE